MASWETFPAMFKFLQGNVESASPLGPWAAPLFLVCFSSEPQLVAFPVQGFRAGHSLPGSPWGGFHQAKAMSSAGTACKAQIHHGSLHCTNASGKPCRTCSYPATGKTGMQGFIYRGTCRCNLLTSPFFLCQWGQPESCGSMECHAGKPTLSTPCSHGTLGSPCELLLFTPTLWTLRA